VKSTLVRVVAFLLVFTFFSTAAQAWGNKEHIQLTRIAVNRLLNDPATPPAMKEWLKQITPNLFDMKQEEEYFKKAKVGYIKDGGTHTLIEYWAIAPDIHAGDKKTKIEPYGIIERPLHYIDLEFFLTGDQQRKYKHDLSGKPKLADFPKDLKDPRYVQAGYLPFRLEESYDKLVAAIRAGRLMPKDPTSRVLDDNALRWAGYLAHYIGDNTQPHHATEDFQSKSYFANKARGPNIHNEMEWKMNDDVADDYADLRTPFWAAFVKELETIQDPVQTKELFAGTLEIASASYDALPMIGLAAMKAAKQGGTPDDPQGPNEPVDTRAFFNFRGQYMGKDMSVMEMKAHQQAWAIVRIQKLLRQAWDEGSK
jgi:hypothetical protein